MEHAAQTQAPAEALAPQQSRHGLSGNTLKNIAILAMLIDHVAWAFVPSTSVLGIAMHFVGRITGPTMFYFIAEGYHYTRNANKYTLRLAAFALISWLPFFYFEFGMLPSLTMFTPFGVIYTLLLGLLAIRARHEIDNTLLKAVVIAGLMLLSMLGDWPLYGVVLPLLFDVFRSSFKKQAIAASCVFVWSIVPNVIIMASSGLPFTLENYGFCIIQLGQFLPLVLLYFYNGTRGGGGRFAKWFFYIIYPLHLLVLGLIKYEMLGLPRGFF